MSHASEDPELLEAVLFDMDGLLVDSEPQWLAAETRTVAELGAGWGAEQQVDLLGSNLEYAARYMIRHACSEESVESVMERLLNHMTDELADGVSFRAGAVELLDALSQEQIPTALVTSSVRVHVDAILRHLPESAFADIVTADDVTRRKPDPEPYLQMLSRLGAAADRTVVLEDSPAGVAAAEAAGCHVLAVPSVVAMESAERREVVASLSEVTVDDLRRIVTRS